MSYELLILVRIFSKWKKTSEIPGIRGEFLARHSKRKFDNNAGILKKKSYNKPSIQDPVALDFLNLVPNILPVVVNKEISEAAT